MKNILRKKCITNEDAAPTKNRPVASACTDGHLKKNKKGFTLAEVLITLVIIGVVAALTIPSLLASTNDKTYDAKRQGFATRMAQAIAQLGMLNAYEDTKNSEENSSMNFIAEGLQNAYAITSVCEINKFKACDFPENIRSYAGGTILMSNYQKWSQLNPNATAQNLGGVETNGAIFRTKNGESVLLWYNPKCISEQTIEPETVIETGMDAGSKNFAKEICVNMVYDLDGAKKGPNQIGRDIGFAIILYPDTPYLVMTKGVFARSYDTINGAEVTKPSFASTTSSTLDDTADGYCSHTFSYSGFSKGDWSLASREEIYADSINYNITLMQLSDSFQWSSTVEGSGADDYAWQVAQDKLIAKLEKRSTSAAFRCAVEPKK